MNLHLTLYNIFCIFIRVITTHFLSTPNILSLHWCWTEDQQFQSSRTRGSSRSGERLRWLSGSKTGRHAQPRTLWLKWKQGGEVNVAVKQTRCFLIGQKVLRRRHFLTNFHHFVYVSTHHIPPSCWSLAACLSIHQLFSCQPWGSPGLAYRSCLDHVYGSCPDHVHESCPDHAHGSCLGHVRAPPVQRQCLSQESPEKLSSWLNPALHCAKVKYIAWRKNDLFALDSFEVPQTSLLVSSSDCFLDLPLIWQTQPIYKYWDSIEVPLVTAETVSGSK